MRDREAVVPLPALDPAEAVVRPERSPGSTRVEKHGRPLIRSTNGQDTTPQTVAAFDAVGLKTPVSDPSPIEATRPENYLPCRPGTTRPQKYLSVNNPSGFGARE
jgi:hypothetical protein